jgi:uncharacterized protein (TIGR03066 family)
MTAPACEEKTDDNKKKLVGIWECSGEGKERITIELAKDGKATLTYCDKNGKKMAPEEFTYEVDDKSFTLVSKDKDGKEKKERTIITKLTDKELVIESGRRSQVFKRIPEKDK